jgi:hypothetical protein
VSGVIIDNEIMIRIPITVHPGSSKRTVEVRDDGLHVYVHVKPVRDSANGDVCELLAEYFHVPRSRVSLFRGERSRQKVIQIVECWNNLKQDLNRYEADTINRYIREV